MPKLYYPKCFVAGRLPCPNSMARTTTGNHNCHPKKIVTTPNHSRLNLISSPAKFNIIKTGHFAHWVRCWRPNEPNGSREASSLDPIDVLEHKNIWRDLDETNGWVISIDWDLANLAWWAVCRAVNSFSPFELMSGFISPAFAISCT